MKRWRSSGLARAWWVGLVAVVGIGLAAGLFFWRQQASRAPLTDDQLKVVDDFNGTEETNLIGGNRFVQVPGPGTLTAAVAEADTPTPQARAMSLRYALPQGAGATWGTGLNELDISAATTLEFWLKLEGRGAPELQVELVDTAGERRAVPVRARASSQWQHIRLPLRDFAPVDTNRFARLMLRVTAPHAAATGALWLDDVAFAGPSRVFFHSLQDNLYGFPKQAVVSSKHLLGLPPPELLRAIAQDTWGYFRDITDFRTHLPLNYIQMEPEPMIGDYVSTTDVGLYLVAVVSALDFQFLDRAEALKRLQGTLEQLDSLPKWRGFLYNYYSTTNRQITNQYISSVDNAWLAVGLVIVRQAFPELSPLATPLLEGMNFKEFYDPVNGQIRLGYEIKEEKFAPYHYGLLATEARIISMIAIGKGDLEPDHWFRVFRTLPKEWDWQRQMPQGRYGNWLGHDVFNGYYVYKDSSGETPIVPSWGGSLFEFLMPTLVVDEKTLAPHGLGLNDQRAVDIHIRYALQDKKLPVWGMSPCATPRNKHGGYSEFGVADLGTKGYKDEGIVTPHVTFLALPFAPMAAEENIRQLLQRYPIYGPYGLYDSVDALTGDVAHRYLGLDQAMIFIALNNYLNDGAIQRRFAADPLMARIRPLLETERFFEE